MEIVSYNMGEVIKNYQMGSALGEGAYGFINLAVNKKNDTKVAIKVITKQKLARIRKMYLINREKDALSTINHPNVLKLIAYDQNALSFYLIFEYLPNGSLTQLAKQHKEEHIIKHVFAQILMGLAAIHQKGIIHRDIKPENILFDDQNIVRIIDFGSSRTFDVDSPMYQPGSFVGSADYISPEIIGDGPVSPASDLWSYACCLYWVFAEVAPFYAETKMDTYDNITKGSYTMSASIPEKADSLIRELLVLEPKDRLGYDSFKDNYKTIREHPFFDGINWETISVTPCII